MTRSGASRSYHLGPVLVDPDRHCMLRGGSETHLEPRVIAVLEHLAQRPGQVVPRSDLLHAVWPGRIVGEEALDYCIFAGL